MIEEEVLALGDRISLLAQSVIRRWSFIGVITLVTLTWWTHPRWFNDPDLLHWNLAASYMALLIESVVGIGMFGQTRRDAAVIRQTRQMAKHIEQLLGHMETLLERP